MMSMNGTKIVLPKPESKTLTIDCKLHGKQEITIVKKPNGDWTEARCPLCYAKRKEEEKAAEDLRNSFSNRAKSLEDLLALSYQQARASFDDYEATSKEQRKALNVCRLFAENFIQRLTTGKNKGLGLLFLGRYGTGKTHLALSILSHLRSQGLGGVYVRAIDVFDCIKEQNGITTSRLVDLLSVQSVLIIDELGVQKGSDFERDRLQQIIDARIFNQLPTVLISNFDFSELDTLLGGRVKSRILSTCYPVIFNWEDHRYKAIDFEKGYKELF